MADETNGEPWPEVAEHRPPDVSTLDEEHQIKEVYSWAGLALYMAQVVEHGLVNLILMVRLSDPTLPSEFPSSDAFWDSHFRQVMGRLVKDVRKHLTFSDNIDGLLDEALRRRNRLAHSFFRDHDEHFMSTPGRQVMVEELADTADLLRTLDAVLEELVLAIGSQHGVTRERIAEALDKLRTAAGLDD